MTNIINFALVAVVVAITIHILFKTVKVDRSVIIDDFKKTGKRGKESFTNKINYTNDTSEVDSDPKYDIDMRNTYGSRNTYGTHGLYNIYNKHNVEGFNIDNGDTTGCPVIQNELDNKVYLDKFLLNEYEKCPDTIAATIQPKNRESADEFHKNFFNFRDKTLNSSSFRVDPVDKITQLYLQGNISGARRYPGMKISDLFDSITAGPKLYERQCVRLPHTQSDGSQTSRLRQRKFDNVNYDGYYMNYGSPGLSLTRDEWTYDKEKIMNGGEIVDNLYPNDLEYNNKLPVLKYLAPH